MVRHICRKPQFTTESSLLPSSYFFWLLTKTFEFWFELDLIFYSFTYLYTFKNAQLHFIWFFGALEYLRIGRLSRVPGGGEPP